MKKIIDKIFGYYVIKVKKEYSKRVINLIIKNSLLCFSPSFFDDWFFIKCSFFGMTDFSDLLHKSEICYEIEKVTGVPFIINRYKERKGLLIGTILGIIIIIFSINFIWDIQFVNADFSPILLEQVENSGIRRGSFIPLLNILDSENRFLLENDEYSFVAFNIKGTVAYVELKKRNGHFENTDDKDEILYSNIVANDNGIVVKVEAFGGFPIVAKGQIVLQGQILITGAYDRLYGGVGLTRSRGKVFAECTRYIEFDVPLEKEIRKQNGKSETRSTLILFGNKIPLYLNSENPFELSYITQRYKRCNLFGFIRLPFDIYEETFYEEVIELKNIDISQAESEAILEFDNRCASIIGDDGLIKNKEYSLQYNEKTNSLKLVGELVYIKNIGIEVPFEVD